MDRNLAKKIIGMKNLEQELRLKFGKLGKKLVNFIIYAIDGIHGYRIKEIIKSYGYPTHKLIGQKGMEAFWLLVQHQDYDVALQEECLKHCDFNLKNKAYLTDRVKVNREGTQIYGTQFNAPIVDKKNVDKRRRKIGLEPLKDYLKKTKK